MPDEQDAGGVVARVVGSDLPLRYAGGIWVLESVGELTPDQVRNRDERGKLEWEDDVARQLLYSTIAPTGAGDGSSTDMGAAASESSGTPTRGRFSTLLADNRRLYWLVGCVIAVTLVGIAFVSLPKAGPADVANRFISSTQAKKYVEANGYLGSELVGGDGARSSSTSAFVVESAKPDFAVTEQSDATAKVMSTGDRRSYMLLSKADGNWKITEICYFTDKELKESVPFETKFTDDSSLWEGIERVTTEGQNGEATFRVTTKLLNEQSSEDSRNRIAVIQQPVTRLVARGTRSRSAGWIPFTTTGMYGVRTDYRFRVTEIAKKSDGLYVSWELENLTNPNERPPFAFNMAVEVAKGSGKRDKNNAIPVERLDYIRPTNSTAVMRLADGQVPEKSRLLFVCGGTGNGVVTDGWLDGYPTRAVDSGSDVVTGDQAYPGPPKE